MDSAFYASLHFILIYSKLDKENEGDWMGNLNLGLIKTSMIHISYLQKNYFLLFSKWYAENCGQDKDFI